MTYQQYIDARYFDYESYAEKIQQERQSTHPEFYQPTTPDEAFAKSLVIPVVKVLDETAQIFDKKRMIYVGVERAGSYEARRLRPFCRSESLKEIYAASRTKIATNTAKI